MDLRQPSISLIGVLLLICNPQQCHSATFIMFCTMGSESHLNPFYTIANALVQRGHEVTIVTSLPPKNHTNITEIFLEQNHKGFIGKETVRKTFMAPIIESGTLNQLMIWKSLIFMIPYSSAGVFNDPAFQKLIKDGKQYDVAINNYFLNDFTLPFASKLGKHVVFAGATGMLNTLAYDLNVPYPISYIPNMALTYVPPMNFLQRAASAAAGVVWYLGQKCISVPIMDGIIQERYPGFPKIEDVKKNISLALVSHNSAADGPQPSVPYIQEIGGIHLRPVKPIPKEFDTFIKKGGNKGFIFVSLGSAVPEELLPEEKNQIFLEVFSKLPYQVIWKYKKQRSDLPPNVMTTKWAPQMDILGDKRCQAFITHGGHASLDESLYNGVPMVGMPVFGDQPLNVAKGVAKGYMIDQQWGDLSVENLLRKVNEVIKNPKYKNVAVKQSTFIKDQPQTPLERAVFWLEYVIRHDGAKHLRTAADHLNFFQYFLLDVIAAAAFLLTLIVFVIYKLLKLIVRLACCRSNCEQQTKKKVKKN